MTPVRRELPSQEMLCKLVEYDGENGIFIWKERSSDLYLDLGLNPRFRAAWNTKYSGQKILKIVGLGYVCIQICGVNYLAHRVAWKLAYGTEPDYIDHIDGDRSNNRLANLRQVSACENQRNRKLNKNSTSGTPGVTMCPTTGKWLVKVHAERKTIVIGRFSDLSEAVSARLSAQAHHGFHTNHGRIQSN